MHKYRGFNYRMDGLQAAILSVKLKHLDAWNDARRILASEYDRLLTSTGTLDGSLVWSALFVLIAMGMTLFAIVSKVERLAIPWHVSVRVEDAAAYQS